MNGFVLVNLIENHYRTIVPVKRVGSTATAKLSNNIVPTDRSPEVDVGRV